MPELVTVERIVVVGIPLDSYNLAASGYDPFD
jgi:hypothetical protein